MEQHYILGIKVTSATMDEIHSEMTRIIQSGKTGFVLSANVHGVNLARSRPWLQDFFRRADIVHIDGAGVILAGRYLGLSLGPRLTWADWYIPMSEYLARQGHRLFLLGGPEGLARQAAERLQARIPDLNIVGTRNGFFEKHGPENDEVIRTINEARPDVVWVGMGMPLQERWILDNHERMNAKLYMICGQAFRYMAGWLGRSPKWFIDHDLEWLWMFFQNPRRGFIRYVWGNPVFLAHVIAEKMKKKSAG